MTAGPAGSDRVYHEDCWTLAQRLTLSDSVERQLDYQRQIAAHGLVALLSPYVSVCGAGDPGRSRGLECLDELDEERSTPLAI